MDPEIGLVGTTAMGCQPHDHLPEGTSDQVIRILTTSDKIDLPNEGTTRAITIIGMTITEQPHHTSRAKTTPGIGEVTMTIRDRLQRRDKIPLLRISATNHDQLRLILQYLTDLGIETRATIYPMKRNSQLLTTVISQM